MYDRQYHHSLIMSGPVSVLSDLDPMHRPELPLLNLRFRDSVAEFVVTVVVVSNHWQSHLAGPA
jgi:hypothetical protein